MVRVIADGGIEASRHRRIEHRRIEGSGDRVIEGSRDRGIDWIE